MKKLQYSVLALAVGTALACTPTIAYAQNETTKEKKEDVEVISVTATGRTQRTEDIPYNISAISGEELTESQITNEADLMRALSGVNVIDRGARNAGAVNSIVMRGINVDGGNLGDNASNAAASVATYVGNTPIYANFILRDIDRVEALRGPQGTLYGSGSLGGTIRLIPNQPEFDITYGNVSGTLGQTDGSEGTNRNYDGMLNLALSDKFAVRAHIGKIDNDGVIDYVNAYKTNQYNEALIDDGNGNCLDPRSPNTPDSLIIGNVVDVAFNGATPIGAACFENKEDADTVDITHGRVAAKYQFSEKFNALLAHQYQKDEIGARRAVTPGDNGQPAGSKYYFEYGDDDIGLVLLEPSEREVQLTSLDLEWDFGPATLNSNTSVYTHEGVGDRDNGGLWATRNDNRTGFEDLLFSLYTGWSRPAQQTVAGYDEKATTQELRLVSNGDNDLDWIVGAFYLKQDRDVYSNSLNPGMNNFAQACARTQAPECSGFWPSLFFPGQTLTENDFEYKRFEKFSEFALYGELNYQLTDKLDMAFGFRWFDNSADSSGIFGFPLVEGWESDQLPDLTDEESGTLFKVNASYKLDSEKMVYGTISEGFRRGGVNTIENTSVFAVANLDNIRTYAKDTVINYEFGLKGFSRDLRYTVAAFYMDWSDPQVNTASGEGFLIAANADKAATYGVESEFSGRIGEDTNYRISYTWTKAELTKDFYNPQYPTVITAVKGTPLPSTAEHVLSGLVGYTWYPSYDGYFYGQLTAYYQSASENTTGSNALSAKLDSFSIFGASLSYIVEDWTATLYAQNLTNSSGTGGGIPCSFYCNDNGVFEGWYGNANIEYIAQPRTVGLSFIRWF